MAKTFKQKFKKRNPGVDFEKEILHEFCPTDFWYLTKKTQESKTWCKKFNDNCVECWNQNCFKKN